MRTTAEHVTDVRTKGAHVGALRAGDAKPDLRQVEGEDAQVVDVKETRLAVDGLALTGQLMQGRAVVFDSADHGRNLLDVPAEFGKRLLDIFHGERWHRLFGDDLTIGILRIG